ncbi:LOW QUALITY PROTEIN: hypothetical protein U9M48_020921 [Paspalum notatum var. saurae]|uniref:Peptidase C1A papain C-terminal domain-containing protein n=1 Tax=Paspalum notatum var. saurae TaxID=547442 RepID=A0AAQ3TFS4_PASNO
MVLLPTTSTPHSVYSGAKVHPGQMKIFLRVLIGKLRGPSTSHMSQYDQSRAYIRQHMEAYEHAIKQGCVSKKSYPLRWFRGDGKCIECGLKVVAEIHGFIWIEPTEKALMRAISKQSVAVYTAAPLKLKKTYRGGLIEFHHWPAGQKGEKPRHAVVVVGYGKDDNGNLYWKVKNSWGNQWGDRGFGYLRRGSSDKGGMMDAPSPNLMDGWKLLRFMVHIALAI